MRKEIVLSGFWLVLSLYLVIESHRLGLSTGNRPGPGFFPFGAAAAIGILAGFRLVKNSRRRSAAEVSESAGNGETHLVLAVIAGMVVYVFLLDVLGFLLCTFLLVAFQLKVVAARAWRVSASFAAAVGLMSHLFFDVLLNAQLPRGLLGGWFNQRRQLETFHSLFQGIAAAAADVNKLVKEEIDKYSRFTPADLGWKAQQLWVQKLVVRRSRTAKALRFRSRSLTLFEMTRRSPVIALRLVAVIEQSYRGK